MRNFQKHGFFGIKMTRPSVRPSIQAGPEAWYPGAGIFGWTWGRITTSQEKSNKSQLETRGAGGRQRRLREAWAQNVQD